MKVLTGEQMRSVDNNAIHNLKIPSLLLMENAGRAVAEKVFSLAANSYKQVVIICGKGNNGGDGFVAARHLFELGVTPKVVSFYYEDQLSTDNLTNLQYLKHFTDVDFCVTDNLQPFYQCLLEADIIVDAILGTGLNTDISDRIHKIVSAINESNSVVVAVDIPTGIASSNGAVLGSAIVADYTVTFATPKIGLLTYPGTDYAGKVSVANIGIPSSLISENESFNVYTATPKYIKKHFPIRPSNSNKGTFGKVYSIAGSYGMSGAAFLSAYAALKIGAGYSYLVCPEKIINTLSSFMPEIIYSVPEYADSYFTSQSVDSVMSNIKNADIVLMGPGIGTNPDTVEFIQQICQLLSNTGKSAVIDADALNCIATLQAPVIPAASVITPHPGELSRLLDISVSEIQSDRIKYARLAAEKFECCVVLKGAATIICNEKQEVYINTTGGPSLAKAGSGDVLAGIIAGFISQGCNTFEASIIGAYLHGLTGDILAGKFTQYCVTASDLIEYLPEAVASVTA